MQTEMSHHLYEKIFLFANIFKNHCIDTTLFDYKPIEGDAMTIRHLLKFRIDENYFAIVKTLHEVDCENGEKSEMFSPLLRSPKFSSKLMVKLGKNCEIFSPFSPVLTLVDCENGDNTPTYILLL
jgi:hypothetical protein